MRQHFISSLTNITECPPIKIRRKKGKETKKKKRKKKSALLSVSVQITERQMTHSGNVQVANMSTASNYSISFKVKESSPHSHLTSALYPCNNPKLWLLKWPHVCSEQRWASVTSTGCSFPYLWGANIRPFQVLCGTLLNQYSPHFIFITPP